MFCSQNTKDHHGKCKQTPSTKCSNHCCLHLPTLWKLRFIAGSRRIKHFPKLVSTSQMALAEPNRAEQIPKWADPKSQFPNPNAHRGGKVQRSVKSQIPKPDLKSQRRAWGAGVEIPNPKLNSQNPTPLWETEEEKSQNTELNSQIP